MDELRQLASLPLAVVVLSPQRSVASANPAAEQFFGLGLRRLNGRAFEELIAFTDPLLAARMADVDANLSARAADATVAGQGMRRIDTTAAPLLDHPGWQIVTLAESGGAEAMRENALQGDDSVVRGPEILAHEIKNPLAGIRGAAQLLARKVEGSDRALTGLIADEVDRIAKLIDQMQTLSRRTAPELGPCNLHHAVRRACAVIEVQGDAPLIVEQFDPSLPPVLGNEDALVQVLLNLLTNAADACRQAPERTITVRTRFASGLQFHPVGDAKPVRLPIELRISDNGPGIDPALRDHLFEPFVTGKKSGQGLGLALVRRLVRDMNGRITHDRDEEAGLTHFRLHLAMADERQTSIREAAA